MRGHGRRYLGYVSYRALACIVAGRRSASVFVGAARVADWARMGAVIEHAAAALVER